MNYYVYILSNNTNVAIYTGVTNDIIRRVYEHKNNINPKSFTSKYSIHKLVYFEITTDAYSAIAFFALVETAISFGAGLWNDAPALAAAYNYWMKVIQTLSPAVSSSAQYVPA